MQPIKLSPPAYVRVRLVNPVGEPIVWPRVWRDSYNVNGSRIPEVPPGPARAAVRLANSTWIRALEVPADGRQVNVQIPSGILPARAVAGDTHAPLGGATFTWMSGGATVEAGGSATGEVLLEGVGARPGKLSGRAPNHHSVSVNFRTPPDVLQDLVFERAAGLELQCRVVTDRGKPVAGAVVELESHDRLEIAQLAATDSDGLVRFTTLSIGLMRLRAWADGFVPSIVESVSITPQNNAATVVLSETRGR